MPRFFFDIHDGEPAGDPDGTEFRDIGAAKDEATRALTEIARELLPGASEARDLYIIVRDETGTKLLTIRLDFTIEHTLATAGDGPLR